MGVWELGKQTAAGLSTLAFARGKWRFDFGERSQEWVCSWFHNNSDGFRPHRLNSCEFGYESR